MALGIGPEAVAGLGGAPVEGGGHGVGVGVGGDGGTGRRGGHVGFDLGNEVAVGIIVEVDVEQQPAGRPKGCLVAHFQRADVFGLEVGVGVFYQSVLVFGHGLLALLGRRGRAGIGVDGRRHGRIEGVDAGAQVAAFEHAVRHHPQPADALHLPAVHVGKPFEQARKPVAALVAEAKILLLRGREHGREPGVELGGEVVVFIDPQRGGEAQPLGQKSPTGLHETAGFGVGEVVGERVLAGCGVDEVVAVGHHDVGAVVGAGQQVQVGGHRGAAAPQGRGQIHLGFAVQQVGAHAQGRPLVPVVDVLQLAQALVKGLGAGL